MKKGDIQKGFTIVELIVVITVLAILGTIAFLSLQGYSAKARDTKRKADLGNIRTLIEIKLVEGNDIMSFVDGTGSVITGGATGKIQIAGRVGYDTLSGSYSAGDVNYTALGINREYFNDSLSGDSYKIGATDFNNQYNVAATIEDSGIPDSYVIGTWNPRTVVLWPRDHITDNVFYLSGSLALDTGLKVNDVVRFAATGEYTIRKMYNNQIHVDRIITDTGDNVFLNANETLHLISRRDSGYTIRIGESDEKYTPYKITN